jgi:hypothetical protein
METSTRYFQFRRNSGPYTDPIFTFLEIHGNPKNIDDALIHLNNRYSHIIEYNTKKEFIKARTKAFEQESEMKKILDKLDSHGW